MKIRVRLSLFPLVTLLTYGAAMAMDQDKRMVYAVSSRKGKEPHYYDSGFCRREGEHSILSLFDGIGGAAVAQYLKNNLSQHIWMNIIQSTNKGQQPDMKRI